MHLDDLRSILLSERETGRLTAVAPDIFEKGHAELAAITKKVYAFEDPFSDDARSLIDETLSIRETLQDLFAIRSRKILALTIMHAEGNYYDREEVKRMIPAEREMFDAATASIEKCQGVLLYNKPRSNIHAPLIPTPALLVTAGASEDDMIGEPLHGDSDQGSQDLPVAAGSVAQVAGMPSILAHPCTLVRVLDDMESFMGVDGRIYTLSKGDIVTLPERNAAVLSERNIVLNIQICK
jgi:DNA replication factor GINS